MRERIIVLAACVATGLPLSVQGQQAPADSAHTLGEVVITSTRFEVNPEEDGKEVIVLNRQYLSEQTGKTLAEVLSQVPGLHIDGSYGAEGTNLSYYLRGGKSGQVLVMIDGIPVSDPSDINNAFDFRHLDIETIESIEIVRGGMSTLYGTDAVSGVINIRLKKGGQEPFTVNGRVAGGSYRTLEGSFDLGGSIDHIRYFLNASAHSSAGFSSALDTNATPVIDSSYVHPERVYDRDGFNRQNMLGRFAWQKGPWELSSSLRMENYRAAIDNGAYADDENRQYLSREWEVAIVPRVAFKNGESALHLSFTRVNRFDLNDSSEYAGSPPMFSYLNGYTFSNYYGSSWQADWVNKLYLGRQLKAIAGIYYRKMAYGSVNTRYGDLMGTRPGLPVGIDTVLPKNTSDYQVDPYAQIRWSAGKGFRLTAGGRLNVHKTYGTHLLWSVNPSWLIGEGKKIRLKLFATASTSFRAPSLYQLYSIYGNTGLQPESSLNYESGATLYYGKDWQANVTLYRRKESNSIVFGMAGYENGGERLVEGIEARLQGKTGDHIRFGADISLLRADDSASLYRVPREQYGLYVTASITKNVNCRLQYNYTGVRYVYDWWSSSELELPAYNLLDLNVNYRFGRQWEAFAGLNNILNQEIIAVQGFAARGRNFMIGVRYKR